MSAASASTAPRWVLETKQVLEQAIDKRGHRERVEALKAVAEDLESELQHLRPISAALQSGRNAWSSSVPTPFELQKALRASLADEGTQRDLDRLVRLLKAHREDVGEHLKDEWRAHVDSRIASASALRDIVPYLAGADGIDVDPTALDRLLGLVARGQNKVPTSEAMSALEQAADLLAHLQAQLPEGIQRFLGSAVGGGAALQTLTPEVLAWLTRQGLLDKFRIVPGAPAGDSDE